MKICIVDACFPLGRQFFGMAALWLSWFIPQCGGEVCDIHSAEIVAITCVSPDIRKIAQKIRKLTSAPIVCGGAGALSPSYAGKFSDVVCVGNGQRFIKTLCERGLVAASALPEAWVDGETRQVAVANGFCWDCPPVEFEQNGYRVFCGRGCKKKCFFCQTGWGMEYEENPHVRVLLQNIERLQKEKKTFAYLSNDPMQHSFFKKLPPVEHGSYSMDFIKINGIPQAKTIRLGVEGVSERLRSFCGKPISQNDLVKCTAWLHSLGKSVRWFMIAGLPTEQEADWLDLRDSIMRWKELSDKGSLHISFTAFCPEPATPFGAWPINDDYWGYFIKFKNWFFDGPGWTNRIRIFNPQQPKARMEKIKITTDLPEKMLRQGGNWGPNDRVNYPHKAARNTIAAKMQKELGIK